MAKSDSKLVFYFTKPTKNHRKKGCLPEPLEVVASGMALCPVKTTLSYIDRTSALRGETRSLFVSTIKPHNAVSSATIGRWIKSTLKAVGVDTNLFKSHSTRSASSSGAKTRGASIGDILKRGQWSNASTWQRFYNKRIVTSNARYQKSLFKDS